MSDYWFYHQLTISSLNFYFSKNYNMWTHDCISVYFDNYINHIWQSIIINNNITALTNNNKTMIILFIPNQGYNNITWKINYWKIVIYSKKRIKLT